MKQRNDREIILFLIKQIEILEQYLNGKKEEDFYDDDILKDACYARILVLGEYAGRTSQAFREKNEDIEWEVIRGARNFYVHAYDALDWTKVWETLKRDIPQLKIKLEKIIDFEENN